MLISPADCSGKKPLEGPLKVELEDALALAERFTQQYNGLLRRFEEQMSNTSFILDLLNRQFGWVSSLANRTDSGDIFSVQTVRFRTSEGQDKETIADDKLGFNFETPPAAGDLHRSRQFDKKHC